MTRNAAILFLLLAATVGLTASLGENEKIAIGESLSRIVATTQESAAPHRTLSAQTGSTGALAYYDGTGEWVDEPCSICDVPPWAGAVYSDNNYDNLVPVANTTYYGG